MTEERAKSWLSVSLPVLIGLISFFVVYRFIMVHTFTEDWITAIDGNIETVLQLVGSSTAASVGITALPGDIATPIAESLIDFNKGFLAVLSALYLEKFIVAVSAMLVFRILIPVSCAVAAIGNLRDIASVRSIGMRLLIFSLGLYFLVPASLQISAMVKSQYDESIQQVIDSANNSSKQIQESVGENRKDENAGNGLSKIIRNLQNAGDTIANGTSQLVEYFQKLVSRFVESLAIMIVISCLIPILVLVVFAWLVKLLFNLDLSSGYERLGRHFRRGGHYELTK